MNLNFDLIKDEKTIVGGLEGKLAVKLVAFDVKADKNGNPNYQFKFECVDFPGQTINYNCGRSFYKKAVSDIAVQLDFELHTQDSDIDVLTKASKEQFYLWKTPDNYINFYDRDEAISNQNEEAPDLD